MNLHDETLTAATSAAEVVQSSMTPLAVKGAVILTLWGVSYTLQDVASIVSIAAGMMGIFYTLHLLTKFWWDNFWKEVFQSFRRNHG